MLQFTRGRDLWHKGSLELPRGLIEQHDSREDVACCFGKVVRIEDKCVTV